jgi:hypothetical protein
MVHVNVILDLLESCVNLKHANLIAMKMEFVKMVSVAVTLDLKENYAMKDGLSMDK